MASFSINFYGETWWFFNTFLTVFERFWAIFWLGSTALFGNSEGGPLGSLGVQIQDNGKNYIWSGMSQDPPDLNDGMNIQLHFIFLAWRDCVWMIHSNVTSDWVLNFCSYQSIRKTLGTIIIFLRSPAFWGHDDAIMIKSVFFPTFANIFSMYDWIISMRPKNTNKKHYSYRWYPMVSHGIPMIPFHQSFPVAPLWWVDSDPKHQSIQLSLRRKTGVWFCGTLNFYAPSWEVLGPREVLLKNDLNQIIYHAKSWT